MNSWGLPDWLLCVLTRAWTRVCKMDGRIWCFLDLMGWVAWAKGSLSKCPSSYLVVLSPAFGLPFLLLFWLLLTLTQLCNLLGQDTSLVVVCIACLFASEDPGLVRSAEQALNRPLLSVSLSVKLTLFRLLFPEYVFLNLVLLVFVPLPSCPPLQARAFCFSPASGSSSRSLTTAAMIRFLTRLNPF